MYPKISKELKYYTDLFGFHTQVYCLLLSWKGELIVQNTIIKCLELNIALFTVLILILLLLLILCKLQR